MTSRAVKVQPKVEPEKKTSKNMTPENLSNIIWKLHWTEESHDDFSN